jgi:hypothetical protein
MNLETTNWTDRDGNPAGGVTQGRGLLISWQNGPLGRGEARQEPNGAFVEDVIKAARQRLYFYQESAFRCPENEEAIKQLGIALDALEHRTQRREAAGVEGTHQGA